MCVPFVIVVVGVDQVCCDKSTVDLEAPVRGDERRALGPADVMEQGSHGVGLEVHALGERLVVLENQSPVQPGTHDVLVNRVNMVLVGKILRCSDPEGAVISIEWKPGKAQIVTYIGVSMTSTPAIVCIGGLSATVTPESASHWRDNGAWLKTALQRVKPENFMILHCQENEGSGNIEQCLL